MYVCVFCMAIYWKLSKADGLNTVKAVHCFVHMRSAHDSYLDCFHFVKIKVLIISLFGEAFIWAVAQEFLSCEALHFLWMCGWAHCYKDSRSTKWRVKVSMLFLAEDGFQNPSQNVSV